MPKKVDILLIALSSPVKIGIYANHTLVESIESEGKSSDVLPVLFQEILRKYEPQRLFYANGPGSFMAIKVAYIFLKSLSILKKIPLYATDAFYFNNNEPIKAIGKLYFVKIASKIETQKLDRAVATSFELPAQLDFSEFTTDTTPHYMIGAVG
jgi:tRNA A37 threonylcarbamoyladenosine modification protein TsaB